MKVKKTFLLLTLNLIIVQAQKKTINLDDLGELGGLFDALSGASKQAKDGSCPHKCKDSLFPVPKKRIRPYSNGCSVPESMRKGLGDYSHFEACCDLHDACYMSCGVHKPLCESEFQKCMKHQCKAMHSKKRRKECENMASLFVTGTSIFGCKGYMELQDEGCECVSRVDAETRAKEYAEEFYATYNGTHVLPEAFTGLYFDLSPHLSRGDVIKKHGEMFFRLYRKYPQAIHVISRDGKSGRKESSHFIPPSSDEKPDEL